MPLGSLISRDSTLLQDTFSFSPFCVPCIIYLCHCLPSCHCWRRNIASYNLTLTFLLSFALPSTQTGLKSLCFALLKSWPTSSTSAAAALVWAPSLLVIDILCSWPPFLRLSLKPANRVIIVKCRVLLVNTRRECPFCALTLTAEFDTTRWPSCPLYPCHSLTLPQAACNSQHTPCSPLAFRFQSVLLPALNFWIRFTLHPPVKAPSPQMPFSGGSRH